MHKLIHGPDIKVRLAPDAYAGVGLNDHMHHMNGRGLHVAILGQPVPIRQLQFQVNEYRWILHGDGNAEAVPLSVGGIHAYFRRELEL